ncbi:ATP-dependent RNA helicase BRR2 KNAG_0G01900 [Huiozyma naganishii CBS 8797]|uniref:U5 small nuclear ribonucleoprotein 200 kDa helicase n=1 Tax=Huiozyma naganishii (strain ATCC MYA-139 / BCRC 22969 / CBS 8797 / KCTC 17520 / NBRC 10181 / NCYC 3082 / Yp74L-3) TaxID=1071383 RepID=J7S106_HUIN7|nr:hypothetical protein KNAG_0G01900 [Kazachstania naganishii CBS 8797]CCK71247.1 hypothetical protein KNAG_0G01900 [Kazachstania naganishii CBS 8797]
MSGRNASSHGDDDDGAREKRIKEIYRYDEMSNKVLRSDKRFQSNQTDPLKDAEMSVPKSLAGRITVKEMGSQVRPESMEDTQIPTEPVVEPERPAPKSSSKRDKQTKHLNDTRNLSVLEMDDWQRLRYHPGDETNTIIYEDILDKMRSIFGDDIPHTIIMNTADIVITSLKSDPKDETVVYKKREQLGKELGVQLDLEQFSEIYKLVNKITDFNKDNSNDESQNEKVVTILADSDNEDEMAESNTLRDEMEKEEEEEEEDEQSDLNDDAAVKESKQSKKSSDLLQNNDDLITIDGSILSARVPPIYLIDRSYVQQKLSRNIRSVSQDDESIQEICDRIILNLLDTENNLDEFEVQMNKLLDFDDLSLSQFFVTNRLKLLWGIKLSNCPSDKIPQLLNEMRRKDLEDLVQEYEDKEMTRNKKRFLDEPESPTSAVDHKRSKNDAHVSIVPPLLDLESLKFAQGSKLLTVSKVELPEGSFKKVKDLYDEIHVPAPKKPVIDYNLVPVSDLPNWAQGAFPNNETETLNAVQSKVYPCAFESDHNLLLCAPTGAGKTNVAMLTVLRTLSKFFNKTTNKLNLRDCKIVYIAPLKALVQEQVREFNRRLGYLGVKVAELTGDSRLNKQEIVQTHILVSTPEKWDIITRKMDESSYAQQVSLIIIDEVHLLHDARGPVLENIVARTMFSRDSDVKPRLVALSATLPNYKDVARFLRVPAEGLFNFDASFRPCPLTQQFIGIREQNSLKKLTAMYEACYDKVLESLKDHNQVIIFVHSRKETSRTASWLKNKFTETSKLSLLRNQEEGSKEILTTESENIQNSSLKKVLESGIGIHHAGLSKQDRSTSEDLFADGLLRVLVCTATLAWGVNLPAHTVIIKGTDVYSPEKGGWDHLSAQDILQMLGRAGRPRYDTFGDGIVITNQSDIQYYLAVLNQQLPIESQLISSLVDSMNAEIVSGNIQSRDDGTRWLTYTFLYVRMLVSPKLYKVGEVECENEVDLISYRRALIHSALTVLATIQLILYNPETGKVEPTELGRISSHFYIKHSSMNIYNGELNEHSNIMDLFRIFSLSDEFKYISIRQEEKRELKELATKAPIPLKDEMDDPLTKTNVLLQAYISNITFDGLALNADMIFIQQSAGRLFRAMFELCRKKQWSQPTKTLLNICKSVDWRMWVTNTPFRQFSSCPLEVIKRTETSTLPWDDYLILQSPAEVGRTIRTEKHGKLVYDLLQRFPKIKLKCMVQPITPSVLMFELEIKPQWIWDKRFHGYGESFIILVEDTDGKDILYQSPLLIREEDMGEHLLLDFSIQLTRTHQKKLPPNFFISVISEKWHRCESRVAAVFGKLQLPKKFPAQSRVESSDLINTQQLENDEFAEAFKYEKFNKIQSTVFNHLYNSNSNILVAAAKGSGKTDMALLAILNLWRQNKGRALYIAPSQAHIDSTLKKWASELSTMAGGKIIDKLGSEMARNLKKISQSHLILATPEQMGPVSYKWQQRKSVQKIGLVIFDDMHEISNAGSGPLYEGLISRFMLMISQLETDTRIVGLSSCLTNARDFGEWMGAASDNIFNFSPEDRISPIGIHLQGFDNADNNPFTQSMLKTAFRYAANKSNEEGTIIYTASKKQSIDAVSSLIKYAVSISWDLLGAEEEQVEQYAQKLNDASLRYPLSHGIGILYSNMSKNDNKLIQQLYKYNAITFLLVEKEMKDNCPKSDMLIVLGTQYFDLKEHRYVSYSSNEILEMIGNTKGNGNSSMCQAVVLTNTNRKPYYRKFLSEAVPTESFLLHNLHDIFMNEIANSVVESKQDCLEWITYSYFYRRIHANPSFYGVSDITVYGISAYLTEMIESVVKELLECDLIQKNDQEPPKNEDSDTENDVDSKLIPLNRCFIGSHYGISFDTMQLFALELSGKSSLRDILQVIANASELDSIPFRDEDYSKLSKLKAILPLRYSEEKGKGVVSYKIFVLLQAYFSRVHLPYELSLDLKLILERSIPLVNAVVDILSSDGYLNASTAMDISQMVVQGVWDIDSPLKQIPFFDNEILKKCKEQGVETVYDVMALDDEERESIIQLENKRLATLAQFINNYPNVELTWKMKSIEEVKAGQPVLVTVSLKRDEVPETLKVTSEVYPFEKKKVGGFLLVT